MIRGKRREQFKNLAAYLFWYTLLFAVVSAGVFFVLHAWGRSFCWEMDASSLYIPKAAYFIREARQFVKGLLHGEFNFKMYDFTLGFGDTVPLHLEPVYWLYLLFPMSRVETAYKVLILLRFYLAGLSFSVFLCYFDYPRWNILIGSMCYVFSGFGLYAGMRHSHFIIPMITLPLLLLSMEEIYRRRRWYLCTIFVAISFWCGYYFTYMNTLMMGVYFLVRFFGGPQKRGIREFLLRMRTIIASYLLGIGIANLTFFNTFANYLSSSRSRVNTESVASLWNYGENWLKNFYQCFLTTARSPGDWLLLGFIPLAYLCIALLFIKKGNRQLKVFFLIGTLFCLVPVFGWIFSGFSGVNNRWCYGYAFLVAVITARMLGELKQAGKREILFLLLSAVPYLWLEAEKYLSGKDYSKSVLYSGLVLVGTVLVVLLLNLIRRIPDRVKYLVLTAGAVGMLWASGLYRFSPDYANMMQEFTSKGQVWSEATGTELQVLDEIEDDSFYRSYTKDGSTDAQGASMMLGYNGVVYYSSTLNSVLIDFYRELGVTSWSLVRLRGFDGRGFLNTLACVKYQVTSDQDLYDVLYGYEEVKEVLRNEVYYQIYENKNVLSIGYCYDQVIALDEFEKLDTAQRQEVMLQAAVLDEPEQATGCTTVTADMAQTAADGTEGEESGKDSSQTGTSEEDGSVTVTGQKAEITEITYSKGVEYDGSTIRVTKKNAEMTICFDGLDNSETYLCFESLHMDNDGNVRFFVNSDNEEYEINYFHHGDANTYATGQEDYLINLGYSEGKKTECTIRFNKKCTLSVEDISIYCQPMAALDDYVADRNEDAMENVEIGTNQVTGTIQASKEELLVFSIPYQNGWTVRIDGEETPIQKVNIMYMGVTVPEGSHTIELTYEMPGLRISLVISAVSLAIFIGALIIRKKRRS